MLAGSDRNGERAAAVYSLIAIAKLNGADPCAGMPMCSAGSPIIQPPGSTNCFPGTDHGRPERRLYRRPP
jgi:hypothetical protein